MLLEPMWQQEMPQCTTDAITDTSANSNTNTDTDSQSDSCTNKKMSRVSQSVYR
jgi:hypothetical protein